MLNVIIVCNDNSKILGVNDAVKIYTDVNRSGIDSNTLNSNNLKVIGCCFGNITKSVTYSNDMSSDGGIIIAEAKIVVCDYSGSIVRKNCGSGYISSRKLITDKNVGNSIADVKLNAFKSTNTPGKSIVAAVV